MITYVKTIDLLLHIIRYSLFCCSISLQLRLSKPIVARLNWGRVQEMMRESFVAFDSLSYGGINPSLNFLLTRVIALIESCIAHYQKRNQMIDGLALSGDHSFKVAKVIMVNGAKMYTAMYFMLNEYGQVVTWWFTYGTSMKEIEPGLKKLAHRYKIHGFEGPDFVTTDAAARNVDFGRESLVLEASCQRTCRC